ncbi:hypothetical protein M2244_003292, partial [Rhodoferax antarcticus]|nr:hypothetical protein [Rhodoferax antarcticus]
MLCNRYRPIRPPKFDTSCTQVIDFIRNGLQSVDYKTGLAKSDG